MWPRILQGALLALHFDRHPPHTQTSDPIPQREDQDPTQRHEGQSQHPTPGDHSLPTQNPIQ